MDSLECPGVSVPLQSANLSPPRLPRAAGSMGMRIISPQMQRTFLPAEALFQMYLRPQAGQATRDSGASLTGSNLVGKPKFFADPASPRLSRGQEASQSIRPTFRAGRDLTHFGLHDTPGFPVEAAIDAKNCFLGKQLATFGTRGLAL